MRFLRRSPTPPEQTGLDEAIRRRILGTRPEQVPVSPEISEAPVSTGSQSDADLEEVGSSLTPMNAVSEGADHVPLRAAVELEPTEEPIVECPGSVSDQTTESPSPVGHDGESAPAS